MASTVLGPGDLAKNSAKSLLLQGKGGKAFSVKKDVYTKISGNEFI